MYLKRGLIFVVFLLFLQVSLAQEPNQCLLVNSANVDEAADRIWNAFSSLGLEAALSAVDSLQPGDNGYLFKEELKEELRRKASGGCIDDYSLNEKDDCWNQGALCVENKCVHFEDISKFGWDSTVRIYLRQLTSQDVNLRKEAASELGKRKVQEIIWILIKSLETDKSEEVRRTIVIALGQIKSEKAVFALIKSLETDRDSTVRIHAVWSLGEIGSLEGISAIIKASKTEQDAYVRRKMFLLLPKIAHSSLIIDGLLKALESDPFEGVRQAVINGLVLVYDATSDPKIKKDIEAALIKSLETDPDKEVKIEAAHALGKLKSQQAVPALIEALKTGFPKVVEGYEKHEILNALEKINPTNLAFSDLSDVLDNDPDVYVKSKIAKMLVARGYYREVANSLVNSINFISSPEGYIDGVIRYYLPKYAVLINQLHVLENRPQDTTRTTIIKGLTTNSIYYLISVGGADLYTSTFLKMYQKLCKNPASEDRLCRDKSFIQEIEQIDQERRYTTDFYLRLANFNRLTQVLQGRESYFNTILTNALTSEDNQKLLRNSVLLTSTLQSIFTQSSLAQYKTFTENLLLDNFNSARNNKDKLREGIYGYFIKLEYNNFATRKQEALQIASQLPEIQEPLVPAEFLSDNKIIAKLYFYEDEGWYKITMDWLQQDGFTKTKINDKTFRFSKFYNGKTLEIIVTTDNSDVEESINSREIDIIAHRGHSFHLTMDTFTPDIESDAKKLLYLGSCGSFGSVPQLQKQFPNAYFIADEDTGRGADNHRILIALMKQIADGERDWSKIKENTYKNLGEIQGIVWPFEKSLLLYNFIQKYTGMSIETLLKNEYGYVPEDLFLVMDRCEIQEVSYWESVS